MPRLLIHSTEFPPGPGGIGTHAYQLAHQLSACGWKVVVLTAQDYAPDNEITHFNQAQAFHIVRLRSAPMPALKLLYRTTVLQTWLHLWPPDLVLATGSRAVWMCAMLARRRAFCWVAIGHGSEFGVRAAWARALTRWSFSRANLTICVSHYTRDLMLRMGVRPLNDAVIPNGADEHLSDVAYADCGAAWRAEHGFANAALLLTVGTVTERKGHDIVIRALPTVLAAAPNTHYLIAGLPRRRAELRALAQQLGVAGHVHFLGRVDDAALRSLYYACDVFIMTSRATAGGDVEGFGIAAVEAALCGKPAIVSRGTGLEEAVQDGRTGLVVPAEDSAATAKAIGQLLSDPYRRLFMGQAARQRALDEQTWPLIAAHYDELLQRLVNPFECSA